MKKLFLILLSSFSLSVVAVSIDDLVNAIHKVETSGKTGAILGDYDKVTKSYKALGPMQIQKVCWIDSVGFDKSIKGKYQDCTDLQYSKKIFVAYSARYTKGKNFNNLSNLSMKDCEEISRLWNAGPSWKKKMEKTNKYWEKVKSFLVK